LIEREYYSLVDAANMIGGTVDDLLHLGASGRIPIIVLASCLIGMLFDKNTQPVNSNLEKINDKYCLVHKDDVRSYESIRAVGKIGPLKAIMKPDNSGCYWSLPDESAILMSDTSLFILTRDIHALRDIEREYYSLDTAANMIGCTVDDLLHYGATGRIPIIALTSGLEGVLFDKDKQPVAEEYGEPLKIGPITDRYCFVDKNSLSQFESINALGKTGPIPSVNTPDNSGNFWIISPNEDFIPVNGNSLFILTSDLHVLRDEVASQRSSKATANQTTQNSSIDKAINLASAQQKRLDDLRNYMNYLKRTAEIKGIHFDTSDLPLTKISLLKELQQRYKKSFGKIKIDQFENDWVLAKKQGICANQRATEQKGKAFLMAINK
jgi:hypothetical protein